MEYEKELRERGEYGEIEIQEKLEEIKCLSELKPLAKLKVNDKYISLDIDGLNCLRGMITDDSGKALKGKGGLLKDINAKLGEMWSSLSATDKAVYV